MQSSMAIGGDAEMWFMKKRPVVNEEAAQQEAEATAINSEIIQKLNRSTAKLKKVNEAIEKDGGVTYRLWLATGGDKRMRP